MNVIEQIEKASNATRAVVAGIRADQLTAQTPCAEWDARALLNHLLTAMSLSTASALGQEPPGRDGDRVGDDPLQAYDETSAQLLKAWAQPGVLDRTLKFAVGDMPGSVVANITLMELSVHGWDLARATGQTMALDDDTAQAVDTAVRAVVQPNFRQPGFFSDEQPAPQGASLLDRAAAFTGRAI